MTGFHACRVPNIRVSNLATCLLLVLHPLFNERALRAPGSRPVVDVRAGRWWRRYLGRTSMLSGAV
eukprot:COSAG02_NODE_2002_length_10139_cov_4.784761_6_plen_66_part_00